MNIFKLSIKNIFSRPLSSVLSILLLSLGVSMISLLILINTVLKDQMDNNLKGIDITTGGIIIMPILISTTATIRSIMMNGMNNRNPI